MRNRRAAVAGSALSFRLLSIFWLLALIAAASPAAADWMNLTGAETAPNIAEIRVLDDRVHVALEIYVGDLPKFDALVPDDWLKSAAGRPSLERRLARFSNQGLRIIADDATRLQARLLRAEPRQRKDRFSPFAGMVDPITRRRLPRPPQDKRVLYVELEYPFAGNPETLAFFPPLDRGETPLASIGFIIFHKSVPVIDFRYLAKAAKLRLDWSDPWYSKFENPNLRRHHASALMTFLYVEPREVRHEALLRVRDMADWMKHGLRVEGTIEPRERTDFKRRAADFLRNRNPLSIDGIAAKPAHVVTEFLKVGTAGLELSGADERLEAASALIGVILAYPVTKLPQKVSVDWQFFPDRVARIPATAIDEAGPLIGFIEPSDPRLTWQNHLLQSRDPQVRPVLRSRGLFDRAAWPVLALALVGAAMGGAAFCRVENPSRRQVALTITAVCALIALFTGAFVAGRAVLSGPPSAERAGDIVRDSLRGLNNALMENSPTRLAAAFDVIIAPGSRSDVEAEIRRALTLGIPGGGVARMEEIENLSLQDLSSFGREQGFRTLARWSAIVRAGHWGHVHRRRLEFRALMEFLPREDRWLVEGITVLAARQADQKATVAGAKK